MMLIVTGSVIGRSAFNYPLPDDLLIVGLLMVVVITFPLAYIRAETDILLLLSFQIAYRAGYRLPNVCLALLLGYFWALWHFCVQESAARICPKALL